jgi:hypothetical protein
VGVLLTGADRLTQYHTAIATVISSETAAHTRQDPIHTVGFVANAIRLTESRDPEVALDVN